MISKKRSNTEILEFLSEFANWISQRLQKIEIIRLSSDHIKQTEIDIKELDDKIQKAKKEVKDQEKIHKEAMKKIGTLEKIRSFNPSSNLFEPSQMDGIEIFQIEEEEENTSQEEETDEI
jgi:hypothetical protein